MKHPTVCLGSGSQEQCVWVAVALCQEPSCWAETHTVRSGQASQRLLPTAVSGFVCPSICSLFPAPAVPLFLSSPCSVTQGSSSHISGQCYQPRLATSFVPSRHSFGLNRSSVSWARLSSERLRCLDNRGRVCNQLSLNR